MNYSSTATAQNGGSYSYTGSSVAQQITSSTSSRDGAGTIVSNSNYGNGPASYTSVVHDSGSSASARALATTWNQQPGGTWSQKQTSDTDSGSSSSSFSATNDGGATYFYPGFSQTTHAALAQNGSFSYSRSITVGANGTTSGSGSGSGWSTGTMTETNSTVSFSTTTSRNGSSHAEYTYSGNWSETYGNGTTTSLTGTNTQTGATAIYINGNSYGGPYSQTQTGVSRGSFSGETYTSIPGNPGGQLGMGQGAPSSTPCFVAGTQVLVGYDEQGQAITKNIEAIQVGDTVLSRDQNHPDAPVEAKQVTAIDVHTVYRIRLLTIQETDGSDEILHTTDEHPFWVPGVGWVKAGDLQAGQTLLTPDGRLVTLCATASEDHPEGISVYNFTVEGDHTYFVAATSGDEMVWVHNVGVPGGPGSKKGGPGGEPNLPPPSNSSPGYGASLLQGVLNAINGAQDLVIHTVNSAIQEAGGPGLQASQDAGMLPRMEIPSPDWSKRLADSTESDSVHGWSKFSAEFGWGLISLKLGGGKASSGPKAGATPPPLPAAAPTAAAETAETTVIGKLNDLNKLQAGERTLLDRLPNLGNPKANWYQNSSVLRDAMSKMRPIRDASVDAAGNLINDTGFLRAERNLLRQQGWVYDQMTRMWNPPPVTP